MIAINTYEKDGFFVEEYSSDGNNISHTVKVPAPQGSDQPTLEEQILSENQYQTALLEMNMMGGAV